MYIETWLKVDCPECSKVNWLCGGDLTDPTVADMEGWQCWKCATCWAIDGAQFDEDNLHFNCELGLKKPEL